MQKVRKYSVAFCGGAFGDEGKGRIVDEFVNAYSQKKAKVIVYRDNGGSNAGHTVEFGDKRLALHQLPSGIFNRRATVVLGKGMVLHPEDLIEELNQAAAVAGSEMAKVLIDEMAVLCLPTHRAYEAALKIWQEGGRGATGRGIGPAYADFYLRQPLRMRDLMDFRKEALVSHYRLYKALLKGLNLDIEKILVPVLGKNDPVEVGSEDVFLRQLKKQSQKLGELISDVTDMIHKNWNGNKCAFVFEKAQAIGLDPRWGVYPDVTSSDTTFDGIRMSTEGIIDPDLIEKKVAVIKATYMSSVGKRKIPTLISGTLADRIREDAGEYGATTKRPRDIAYLDLPALTYFAKVGGVNALVLTHMDIVYPDKPVRICTKYLYRNREVSYRPDQEFLLKVKPVYKDFEPWDKSELQQAKNYQEIPRQAKKYLRYVSEAYKLPILLITTGPKRHQTIYIR